MDVVFSGAFAYLSTHLSVFRQSVGLHPQLLASHESNHTL
jgi:hypothetical protein